MLESLRVLPEIESCYFMAGVESFLLKARVGTIAELEQLIVRLNRTPGVASTRTAIALSTKWENRPSRSARPRPDRRVPLCRPGPGGGSVRR